MDSSPCSISTYTLGRAASAACLVASNGSKGKRFAGKNAEFMFHEIYGDVSDLKYSDIIYYRNLFKKQLRTVNRIFSKNTGKSNKEIKATFMDDDLDKWMSATEAKKFGIIDKISCGKRK
jgi:ATP-dependent Clp protease protease subunit